MNTKKALAFLEEITLQCRFAMIAGQDIARCYQNMEHMIFSQNIPESNYRLETERLWYSIQSLLVATANVAKLLWPEDSDKRNQDKRNKEDAKMLRNSLAISDTSPLRNKRVRNRFEHFDEWLERAVQPRTTFINLHIGELPVITNQDKKVYARIFNPEQGTIAFQEEILSISDVMHAVIDLERKARLAIEKPFTSRWQIPPKEPI